MVSHMVRHVVSVLVCYSVRRGRPGLRPLQVPGLSLAASRSARRRASGGEAVDVEDAVPG